MKNKGIKFLGGITIILIILKLSNIIVGSWWLVLAPVWFPIAMLLLFLIILLFIVWITSKN